MGLSVKSFLLVFALPRSTVTHPATVIERFAEGDVSFPLGVVRFVSVEAVEGHIDPVPLLVDYFALRSPQRLHEVRTLWQINFNCAFNNALVFLSARSQSYLRNGRLHRPAALPEGFFVVIIRGEILQR